MPRAIAVVLLLVIWIPAGLAQTGPGAGAPCVGGNPSSPVKIEVFSDYQCPACRAFYLGTMRQVLSEYADAGKVCVVYHEFPLNIHPHAPQAARYGHAALLVGKRQWSQVTNAIFEAQEKWSQDGQLEPVVAGALSREDMEQVRKLAAEPATNEAIRRDIELGRSREVNSTPTFFITAKGKTEKVAGVVQFPILKRYLDSLLGQ
ncbi:MAG: DsbA family protein [Terriglobia bacterium]